MTPGKGTIGNRCKRSEAQAKAASPKHMVGFVNQVPNQGCGSVVRGPICKSPKMPQLITTQDVASICRSALRISFSKCPPLGSATRMLIYLT